MTPDEMLKWLEDLMLTAAMHCKHCGVVEQCHEEIGLLDALIAAVRAEQQQEIDRQTVLTVLEARIRAKFTPALNTGSAMDALVLVAEALRELKAELSPSEERP